MSLRIVRSGLLTTIQDAGRFGYRSAGVIVSGPVDAVALHVGNLLVGNPPGVAALELAMPGPTIRFEADHLIALTGADFSPTLNGQPVKLWRPMAVTAGCELAFGAVRSGRWSYLAVSGSFDVPQVLGSASTYLKAGIGGFQGRTLQAGDALPTKEITTTAIAVYKTLLAHSLGQRWAQAPWTSGPQPFTLQTEAPIIRAIAGPEYHLFDTASQQAFWQQPFTLSPHSDRMGARLQGPPLTLRQPQEILSTAVTFGTVQVPAGGSPIVLLADHQTTGGYPRIAQVISADFSRLAQAALGKPLRFQQVSLAEAQRAYLHQQQHLQQLERAIALRSLFT